jgi:hypothetical protein
MALRLEVFSVECPSCGQWALLRARTAPGPPTPIGFSCPGRRDPAHHSPGQRALARLLTAAIDARAEAIAEPGP